MRDIYVSSFAQALSNHTAILQTLNRLIGGIYFSADPFAETVDNWNDIPIIFSQNHPNMENLIFDPVSELARIGGREVGKIKNPRIEMAGHPRLMSDTEIYDPVVNDLIDQGKASLSTGFWASDDNFKITGNVIPNHLLVFQETLEDQPRDLGAGFLNKFSTIQIIDLNNSGNNTNNRRNKPTSEDSNTDPTTTPAKVPNITAGEIAKLEKVNVEDFLNMQKKYKNALEQSKAVTDEQHEKIKDLEAKIAAFTQMERDQKWEQLKPMLPRGLVVGEEVQKTREWLNKDPEGLLIHVINIINRDHNEELRAQGKEYLQNVRKEQKAERDALCAGIYVYGEEGK